MPYKDLDKRREYFRRRNAEPGRTAARLVRRKRQRKNDFETSPFVAIDSEGFTFGENILDNDKVYSQHKTFLWGAGDKDGAEDWLYKGRPLTSLEICKFLTSLPDKFERGVFVSFAFGYDVAQILADLPYEQAWEIQRQREFESDDRPNSRRPVFWKNYGFSYLKGKRLIIYRMKPNEPNWVGKPGYRRVNCAAKILIYDVFGFFQASFIKAFKSLPGSATPEEKDLIERGKKERAIFQIEQIDFIRQYTAAELRVLSRMMTLLRESMAKEGIHLRSWFGAGSIAQALMKRENVAEHYREIRTRDLDDPQTWAHHAYFGGRIELLKQGSTKRKLYGYDIASAYPAISTTLESQSGGNYKYISNPSEADIRNAAKLSIIHVKTHGFPIDAPFYPLPYRTPKGTILFPRVVNGYYMQEETCATIDYQNKFGGACEFVGMWKLETANETRPFAFLQRLFDYRASLSKEDITQIVIKLGINSCYGKTAQAVASGNEKAPPLANPFYAAGITAGTRARLLKAALADPDACVMFATDGIISERPLPLEIPPKKTLGAWEAGELKKGGVFIQSGVYCISDETGEFKAKSRGFRVANIQKTVADVMREEIPEKWSRDETAYEFPYTQYMTLGAALASRETWKYIGYWAAGKRDLQLRGAGVKRNVATAASERKRRAKTLVATYPSSANFMLLDEDGEMRLSEIFRPDWIDPEVADLSADEDDQEQIDARFS